MEFFTVIDSNEKALLKINEIIDDMKNEEGLLEKDHERWEVYNTSVWTLQELAEFKKIEYSGYFRTKYEKSSEFQIILGKSSFEEQANKRELYVYMAAEDDSTIYEYLQYAYDLTHSDKLTKSRLTDLINEINSKGYIFKRD